MSNVYPISKEKRKCQEASAWVTKLDRGLTTEEKEVLQKWLAESVENKERFMKVAKQWDEFNELSRLAELFPDEINNQKETSPLLWRAIAAVLIIALAGVLSLSLPSNFENEERTRLIANSAVYETAVGEQSNVVLEDGSVAVLNTNSRLKVNYSEFHRMLILERGEIHIVVAPNPSRPLTVFAANKMIQAIGTAFSVEIIGNKDIEVVVTEGKVRLAAHPVLFAESKTPEAIVLPPSLPTIEEGEEARLGSGKILEVTKVTDEDIDVRLAWREGDLIFRGESLGKAMAEVSRYTTIEFVFLNEELKKERIIGRFKAGDVDGLLAVLSGNLNIAYQRTQDGRVLLGSL